IRPFIASALLLVVIIFLPGGLASLLPRRRVRVPAGGGEGADGAALLRASGRPTPAAGETVVRVSGGNKDYGGVHAVRDVDLTVASGEVVGLIGPNGAGKTTLVNMVSGLVPPSSGTFEVLGTTPGR